MKEENPIPNDETLGALLRDARPAPSLPPRFQEGVWRRIEESEIPATAPAGWFDNLMAWALRPKFALAAAVVLIAAGSVAGARQGNQNAHQDARSRYVASVAPTPLR